MPYSKKKSVGRYLSKKKVVDINPREYTIMGSHPEFIHFNPSGSSASMSHPLSHKLEKWILVTLLALAMAAFAGFKLLENSDLSFTLTDGHTPPAHSTLNASNSLSSESEFKQQFDSNRKDARAMLQNHKTASLKIIPKYGKGAEKYYAHSKHSKKHLATSKLKKRHVAKKLAKKSSIAKS